MEGRVCFPRDTLDLGRGDWIGFNNNSLINVEGEENQYAERT